MLQYLSYTYQFPPGQIDSLITPIRISTPFMSQDISRSDPRIKPINALWDTGSTGSLIINPLPQQLGLVRTGERISLDYGRERENEGWIYKANLYMGDIAMVEYTVVSAEPIGPGYNLVIGMDIIGQGDFTLRKVNGLTQLIFRLPG